MFFLYTFYKPPLTIIFCDSLKFLSMNESKVNSYTELVFEKNMKICSETYILSSKLGKGNFGDVYLGVLNTQMRSQRQKNKKQIAIKIQKDAAGKQAQLPNESEILKILNEDGGNEGFPKIYEFGMERGNYFIVMELLGPSIMDLMKLCGGKFSVQTTIMLAMQMFQRVQFLHSKGFLNRDIKPENFLMGFGQNSSVLYMIDFGISRRYRDSQSGLHRPYKEDRLFNGTIRYASICSHLRIEQSRRDDLESLCYVLIFLLKGNLPWQSYRIENTIDTKEKLILDKKLKTTASSLCQGLPLQFKNILEYCLNLEYYEDPDYNFIHMELNQAYKVYIGESPFLYDWANMPEKVVVEKNQKVLILSSREYTRKEEEESQENGDQKSRSDKFSEDSESDSDFQ